jgi:hypothetical protein
VNREALSAPRLTRWLLVLRLAACRTCRWVRAAVLVPWGLVVPGFLILRACLSLMLSRLPRLMSHWRPWRALPRADRD